MGYLTTPIPEDFLEEMVSQLKETVGKPLSPIVLTLQVSLYTQPIRNQADNIIKFPYSFYSLILDCEEVNIYRETKGFPGSASSKEPSSQCRRHKRRGFNP